MDTIINDFSSCEIGEKLWSIQLGDCEVVSKTSEYIRMRKVGNEYLTTTYLLSGQLYCRDLLPSLFWVKPDIKPGLVKRVVKKTEKAFVLYDEKEKKIDPALWDTKAIAENVRATIAENLRRDNFQIVEATINYIVTE